MGGGVKKRMLIMFGYQIPQMGLRALLLVIFFHCYIIVDSRVPKFHFDSACFVSNSGKPVFGTLVALLQNGTPVSMSHLLNAYMELDPVTLDFP